VWSLHVPGTVLKGSVHLFCPMTSCCLEGGRSRPLVALLPAGDPVFMTDTRRLPFASSGLSLVLVIVGAKARQESA
jgi:hypothetical protein